MPTLAILEDSPEALFDMLSAIAAAPQAKPWVVAHTASSCAQMNEWLNANPVDLLVCDLNLPDCSGVTTIRHCHALSPSTEIMVCTIFEDDEHLFESLRSGANGYLLKADISTKFVSALSQMMDGDAPMSPRIARRVLHQLSPTPDLPVTSSILTKKELDILSLIARGFKFLEISQMQGISIHTVHSHIKNIYKKLQVTSKNEAVYEARALKLIV